MSMFPLMRVKPLIAVPLIAIALAGCSTQQPTEETSTAAAQEQPLFSSDEEALAAAQAAYAKYLEVSDQIARDGGANPERLKPLLSEDQFNIEKASFDNYVSSSIHSSGQMTFDSFHLSNSSNSSISAYLCIDSSDSRVLDSTGSDVTPQGRIDRWPLLVSFVVQNDRLVISGSDTWTGKNFC